VEPVWKFYPQLLLEGMIKHAKVAFAAWQVFRIYRHVTASSHVPYTDQTMTVVSDDDPQKLGLFTHNKSARDAVDHARKIKLPHRRNRLPQFRSPKVQVRSAAGRYKSISRPDLPRERPFSVILWIARNHTQIIKEIY